MSHPGMASREVRTQPAMTICRRQVSNPNDEPDLIPLF